MEEIKFIIRAPKKKALEGLAIGQLFVNCLDTPGKWDREKTTLADWQVNETKTGTVSVKFTGPIA